MFAAATPLQLILGVVLLWLAIGIIGVLFPRNLTLVSRALFPAGAAGALASASPCSFPTASPAAAMRRASSSRCRSLSQSSPWVAQRWR